MTVIANLNTPGHITEALVHANQAIDSLDCANRFVDAVRGLSDCLNKLQSEWFYDRQRPDGEMAAFRQLLLDGMSQQQRERFLGSTELLALAELTPQILNHKVLLEGHYRPGEAISDELSRNAAQLHHKLSIALIEFTRAQSSTLEDRIFKRAADLLYVVRSNIAHGEKSPYGFDRSKRERDEAVCRIIAPVQALLVDLLLDFPSTKLVVYGTLAPGEANQSMLGEIKGSWSPCVVNGKRAIEASGLTTFSWSLNEAEHNLQIFESLELPEHWNRLEAFEGARYRRRLVLARVGAKLCVAYAFVARPDSL